MSTKNMESLSTGPIHQACSPSLFIHDSQHCRQMQQDCMGKSPLINPEGRMVIQESSSLRIPDSHKGKNTGNPGLVPGEILSPHHGRHMGQMRAARFQHLPDFCRNQLSQFRIIDYRRVGSPVIFDLHLAAVDLSDCLGSFTD